MDMTSREERKKELLFQLAEVTVEDIFDSMVQKGSFYRDIFAITADVGEDDFWKYADRYIFDCITPARSDPERYTEMIRKKIAEFRATL